MPPTTFAVRRCCSTRRTVHGARVQRSRSVQYTVMRCTFGAKLACSFKGAFDVCIVRYWGYATKYTLVATQMLATATGARLPQHNRRPAHFVALPPIHPCLPHIVWTGSDTGLGAAPGLARTGIWRIHNTGAVVGMFWSSDRSASPNRYLVLLCCCCCLGPLDKSFNWGDSDDDGADEFLVDFFGAHSFRS